MQLSITDAAKEKLTSLGFGNNQNLLLWYDKEGLGCAVNGQPTIRFTEKVEPSFKMIENSSFPTYVDRENEIYFDENLTLDFKNGMFRLESSGEIINAFISPSSLEA